LIVLEDINNYNKLHVQSEKVGYQSYFALGKCFRMAVTLLVSHIPSFLPHHRITMRGHEKPDFQA
jgi:hypothetical protein